MEFPERDFTFRNPDINVVGNANSSENPTLFGSNTISELLSLFKKIDDTPTVSKGSPFINDVRSL